MEVISAVRSTITSIDQCQFSNIYGYYTCKSNRKSSIYLIKISVSNQLRTRTHHGNASTYSISHPGYHHEISQPICYRCNCKSKPSRPSCKRLNQHVIIMKCLSHILSESPSQPSRLSINTFQPRSKSHKHSRVTEGYYGVDILTRDDTHPSPRATLRNGTGCAVSALNCQ